MNKFDYWDECISIAAEECGASLTKEQIEYIAGAVDGGHENIGQAFGRPENPLIGEVDRLKRELKAEREKTVCSECGGRGWIVTLGPYHSAESQCSKCRGEGKI